MKLKSYAKINLSLDVLGLRDDGFHEVHTVMQQLNLYDEIEVIWEPSEDTASAESGGQDKLNIEIKTNKPFLPTDERNLAYRAALIMRDEAERLASENAKESEVDRAKESKGMAKLIWPIAGTLKISIRKSIPVAAGLAGGSGNAAAVFIALNRLWNMNINVPALVKLSAKLGSDIPFMVLAQSTTYNCALGTGKGEEMSTIKKGLGGGFLLVTPRFGVSTPEVYKGLDELPKDEIPHPDTDALIDALERGDRDAAFSAMANSLEAYTLKAYPAVAELKEKILKTDNVRFVMMSGSGPTVIGFYDSVADAKQATVKFRQLGYTAYYAGTKRGNRR